jgi:hypothetical protein
MHKYLTFGLIAFGACTDKAYDPDGPAIDPNAPRVHITSPARGTIAGDVKSVVVMGIAADDTGIASVTVNDVEAKVSPDGTFSATIPVKAGTNLLHAVAKDAQGNTGAESRAVVAGPMSPTKMQVPSAITASLSAQTFGAIAQGTTTYLKTANLGALAQPLNPVIDVGGGPDCLYAQAKITSVTLGDAAVTLSPQPGGLFLDLELSQVQVGMHLQYAVSCLDGSRDITIGANHITIAGMMTVGVVGHDFDIHFDHPNVSITGFDVDLGGVPGTIVDMLHLDTAMGPILGLAARVFVVPMVNKALKGLNDTKTVDVFGMAVDIDLAPANIDFTTAGALVELDTSMRAHADTSGQYVFVDNALPVMDVSHGFQLAVADDAANQLLGSLWNAKALDKQFMLNTGNYGEVGKLFDSVEMSVAVPPFVDASGQGLVLTVGDMMATFRNGETVTTNVAINAQVAIQVTTAPDGQSHFDVGTPTVYVDVLDEAVEGANQLSNSEFEAITSFALSRVVAVGAGSLGAVPLPSLGGVSVKNLKIASQTGYLVVAGEVQ